MKINYLSQENTVFPPLFNELAQPVTGLYYLGDLPALLDKPAVAVVGSRKISNYGRFATEKLAKQLVASGVVIVSGLALGVDAIAHQAALDAGGLTIAVLPGGLDKIYPASHQRLAKRIIESGGALVSEYDAGVQPQKYQFIARNRIVSALGNGVLITEAAEKSGSLHTAEFALEQGKEVFAVPGNINSQTSVGTNQLIKNGATPVTSAQDILHTLTITPTITPGTKLSTTEQRIVELIASGISDSVLLQQHSRLSPADFYQTLSLLEINGIVSTNGNNVCSLTLQS